MILAQLFVMYSFQVPRVTKEHVSKLKVDNCIVENVRACLAIWNRTIYRLKSFPVVSLGRFCDDASAKRRIPNATRTSALLHGDDVINDNFAVNLIWGRQLASVLGLGKYICLPDVRYCFEHRMYTHLDD